MRYINIYIFCLFFIHSTCEASSTTKPQPSSSLTSPRKATLKPQVKGISSSGTALKTAVRVLVKGGKKKTIVGSKAKNISSKQVPKAVKVGKLPLKGVVKKIKKKTLAVKPEASKNQEGVANLDQNPIWATCETITNESITFVKETLAPDSEETMAGIEVIGAENAGGAAAKCAVFPPSEDRNDDDNCTNVEDAVVQDIEACITEDLCSSPKLSTSEELPDRGNSKIVEDTEVIFVSSHSKVTLQKDKSDGDIIYIEDEPDVESSPSRSESLSHQPTEENPGNVSKFTSSKDQPKREVDQPLVVPLVETQSDEPVNMTALEPESDASLDKAIEPVTTEQTKSGQSGTQDGEIVEVKTDMEDVQKHRIHQLSSGADESSPPQALEHVHQPSKKTKPPGGVWKTEAVLEGNSSVKSV